MQNLIVILGPTAVGKTKVSIELAREINGEIICADSRQIYKFMDIGTNKPTKEEQKNIPHHLLDLIYPNEEFSVYHYKRLAEEKISEIWKRKKTPIIVGGTGLYIKAVLDDFSLGGISPQKEIREKLKNEAEEFGNIYLYNKLKKIDPASAEKISPKNLRRIIRALEVCGLSENKKFSSYYLKKENKYDAKIFGLTCSREKLYSKINDRVDLMLKNGLIDEVKNLFKKGYDENLNSLSGIGYKQIIKYLKGDYSKEQAIYLIKRDTRHYAKRQITYFKKDERIIWINVENKNTKEIVKEIRNNI